MIRSILAATDMGAASDAIVRSAAILAGRSGAELHLIHSLEFPLRSSDSHTRGRGFQAQIDRAEERLAAQVERTMPEGVQPATGKVVIYIAHNAILDRAREVSADLMVVGPHRGGAASAHFLGATADRVIRTAEIPCLVVTEPLTHPLRRIGVPLDISDPSRGALDTALHWSLLDRAGDATGQEASRPVVEVMYVGWAVDHEGDPSIEERVVRPVLDREVAHAVSRVAGAAGVHVDTTVVWDNDPAAATLDWVGRRGIDLLVMGTRAPSGIRRALIGSMASRIARRAPIPVLLVPPALWGGKAPSPSLDRVLAATDFSEPSIDAARWCHRFLAPGAEQLLLHVLEVPEPPRVLATRYGSRDELLKTAREGARQRIEAARESLVGDGVAEGAVRTEVRAGRPADEITRTAEDAGVDLVVVGGHGQGAGGGGGRPRLGSTAERLLRSASAPVLVARGLEQGPPRSVLVAVDGSGPSLRAVSWARFIGDRFSASVTALYVDHPLMHHYATLPAVGVVPATPDGEDPAARARWEEGRKAWLREQIGSAGLDPDGVGLEIAVGRPAEEILAARERLSADLIVIGSRGADALGRAILGSVAGAVVRNAPCPVLVVGDHRGD